MKKFGHLSSLILLSAVGMSNTVVSEASAQETDAAARSDVAVSSSIAIVSDYRFRGWSLSGESPAIQIDVEATHASGFYVGAFASSIEEYGSEEGGEGATIELDFYTGWGFSASGWAIDVGAMAYVYPGADGVDYYVLPVSLARSFADLTVIAGFEYTPAQGALGDADSNYTWLEAAWSLANSPVTFRSSVGYEDGAMAPYGKTDWMLSATVPVAVLEFGLSYVDSDEAAAGSAIVAEIRSYF